MASTLSASPNDKRLECYVCSFAAWWRLGTWPSTRQFSVALKENGVIKDNLVEGRPEWYRPDDIQGHHPLRNRRQLEVELAEEVA